MQTSLDEVRSWCNHKVYDAGQGGRALLQLVGNRYERPWLWLEGGAQQGQNCVDQLFRHRNRFRSQRKNGDRRRRRRGRRQRNHAAEAVSRSKGTSTSFRRLDQCGGDDIPAGNHQSLYWRSKGVEKILKAVALRGSHPWTSQSTRSLESTAPPKKGSGWDAMNSISVSFLGHRHLLLALARQVKSKALSLELFDAVRPSASAAMGRKKVSYPLSASTADVVNSNADFTRTAYRGWGCGRAPDSSAQMA